MSRVENLLEMQVNKINLGSPGLTLRGAKVQIWVPTNSQSEPKFLTKWGLGAGVEFLLHLIQHGLHLLDLLVFLVEEHHRLRVLVLALRRGDAFPEKEFEWEPEAKAIIRPFWRHSLPFHAGVANSNSLQRIKVIQDFSPLIRKICKMHFSTWALSSPRHVRR